VGCTTLTENKSKQDGICSGRIEKRENVITTLFHQIFKVRLLELIQDYEDELTEFILLDQKTWDAHDMMKRCLV
jgi:hypothetical protein